MKIVVIGAGALGGAFWGMLFGLLFFIPFLGMAMGAAMGALAGHFSDYGIDDKPVVMGEFPFAGLNGTDYLTVLRSWFGNGYAGALGWSVTDSDFNWSAHKSNVLAFANERPCQTQY